MPLIGLSFLLSTSPQSIKLLLIFTLIDFLLIDIRGDVSALSSFGAKIILLSSDYYGLLEKRGAALLFPIPFTAPLVPT